MDEPIQQDKQDAPRKRRGRKASVPREARVQAIEDILEGRKTQSEAAKELGVTRQAVHDWIRSWKAGKRPRRRGVTTEELLTPQERARFDDCLLNHHPTDLDIDSTEDLWGYEEVHALLVRDFGRDYCRRNCIRLRQAVLGDPLQDVSDPASGGRPPRRTGTSHAVAGKQDMERFREGILEAHKIMREKGILAPMPVSTRQPRLSKKEIRRRRKQHRKNRR